MSKRAEEAALKAYPDYPTLDGGYVTQRKPRKTYIQGYEQAEKDTIERAVKWLAQRGWTCAVQISMFRKEMEEDNG
ncbi:MAG: hypothetical protein J6W09_11260 [Bacteroidales bacterium]|nr:hypothetical protein [Bacteroidales bacterium]